MIEISNVDIHGWQTAIRGMRNPMNSWSKSDTEFDECGNVISFGNNDLNLMCSLAHAGTDHRKFMRMITVTLDINAPLYWWKEFDTYKVGTVANSCSTMHKIQAKKFTLDNFSIEHLTDENKWMMEDHIIRRLNTCRQLFLDTGDKNQWWQMIQLLPSSFNQRRTVMLNYEVLANIYHARRNHKLDEWHTLCDWIATLPIAELIKEHDK